jgi:hypothetical protein
MLSPTISTPLRNLSRASSRKLCNFSISSSLVDSHLCTISRAGNAASSLTSSDLLKKSIILSFCDFSNDSFDSFSASLSSSNSSLPNFCAASSSSCFLESSKALPICSCSNLSLSSASLANLSCPSRCLNSSASLASLACSSSLCIHLSIFEHPLLFQFRHVF